MARSAGAVSAVSPIRLSSPASGGVAVRVKSGTQTLSFRVDEVGRAYLDLDLRAVHRADGADDLALAGVTRLDEAETDGMAEARRIRDRGHPALVVVHVRRLAAIDEMRPCRQRLRPIHGLEAHQLDRVVADHLR